MGEFFGGTAGQPAAFMTARVPSFTDFLAGYAPDLLPLGFRGRDLPAGDGAANEVVKNLPHATTIVAAVCERGVVLAGDRRATSGNMISKRDAEKVFRSDEFSAMAIAGVFAIGLEFVRLFQVELEHYEKMEGRALSLEGKANRLAKMVRDNLGPAMQGLAVVPLFTGYDEETGVGRIFSYDVAGGPYEEHRYFSIGSGSIFAKGSLKKLYRDDMSVSDTVLACVQALYDAADDDSATGGPDLTRQLFPIVATITDDGFRRLPDSEAAEVAEQVVAGRMQSADGPTAPLRTAS
ncbi:MAG TPA: proteasome subunit beta [Solirubrobacterales bacterium]|nr:proteasome subunit beta [Solirubrobacterales bacterium]